VLLFLSNNDKEKMQKKGYMSEHLLCLYSMASDRTALYDNNFPIYLNSMNEADIILFGLADKKKDGLDCIREMLQPPFKELNIVSPKPLINLPCARIETQYMDWDFHIDLKRFNLNLRGNAYKNIRYSIHRADKMGYELKLSREFTPKHTYILARHMARHKLDAWDFEELLSLERFFRDHSHGFMMEAYIKDELVGFDVIDFFEDSRIMVVPLGVYLETPSLPDFLMYENIKYAKNKGYDWLDIGLACRRTGLQGFKEKWFAEPKYQLYVQTIISQK